ncbi:MAG TPA: BatD family protein [Verrucomicrobiae bacterium]|jgi:hypothetical protein|nr:BatD family protein [Verrucomicrobiae bacterium]
MLSLLRKVWRTLNRGRIGLWFALLFAFVCPAFSASFTASLDRNTIVLGEQVTLTLKFEDGQPQGPLSLPVDGLRITSSPEQSISSVFAAGKQTTVYSYAVSLEATRLGEFVIPPFHIKMNGQDFSSQPLKLKVVASDSSAPPAGYAEKNAFLWIALPKTNLYLNEPMVAEFRIYLRSDVHRYGDLQFAPDGNGLTFSKIAQGQQYQRRVGDASFTVVPLSMAITPVKTGTVSLNPINGSIVLNGRDPMDIAGFFGPQARPQQVPLTSQRMDLQVSPLPTEHVPPGFNGAVGTYTMAVTAGPTNVVAGDPITLRIQISGQGPLDTLSLPEQAGWNNFKTYPPTSKITASDPLGIEGSKTFEEIVTPQNSDIRSLPPITFSFFDPEKKQYRTLTQPAMPLLVRAAAPGTMPALAAAHPQNPPPTADVVPIKQHIGALAQISTPLVQQPWFLALQGVPALALISCVILRKRKETLAKNPRLRRQRQVAQLVGEGLEQLKIQASQNQSDEFFATLFRLLQEQIGERLDLPASAITEAVLDERLRPGGVSEETLTSLHELFQSCNLARYAPVESGEELAQMIPKLEKALQELREWKA